MNKQDFIRYGELRGVFVVDMSEHKCIWLFSKKGRLRVTYEDVMSTRSDTQLNAIFEPLATDEYSFMKKDCRCSQERENCECHIPDEEKHKGLLQSVKSMLDQFKMKKELENVDR